MNAVSAPTGQEEWGMPAASDENRNGTFSSIVPSRTTSPSGPEDAVAAGKRSMNTFTGSIEVRWTPSVRFGYPAAGRRVLYSAGRPNRP